jgi:hypothetical protein
MAEQQRAWARKVRVTLVALGVKLPVPESTDLSREFEALNAELAMRRSRPGGLVLNP